MTAQMALFQESISESSRRKTARSGSFLDNLKLPIHRWFRYSAGFSAQWVEKVLSDWEIGPENVVLDPFAGSGTVSIACDSMGISSYTSEAHPMVARILKAKGSWATSTGVLEGVFKKIVQKAKKIKANTGVYPDLVQRSYSSEALAELDQLRRAWEDVRDDSSESELAWLAITSILRSTSKAGTAQWQYILPNKTKKRVLNPTLAFEAQCSLMVQDMEWMQSIQKSSKAKVISTDARDLASKMGRKKKVDAVITSPPYANNFDYADALRFEMSFWGEITGWGDLHESVRKHLIVSSSQHSSREGFSIDYLLELPELKPIRKELDPVLRKLSVERMNHGGMKHYHTMVGGYFRDIAKVMSELKKISNPGVRMCWVVGDSAPYGIYCPVDKWTGELAIASGFNKFKFEKLRDRNIKWKNRKHTVPLKEGLLWIEG